MRKFLIVSVRAAVRGHADGAGQNGKPLREGHGHRRQRPPGVSVTLKGPQMAAMATVTAARRASTGS